MSTVTSITEDLPPGHYLVTVKTGSTRIRPVDPAYAAVAAAAQVAEDRVTALIWEASEMKPTAPAVTEEQRKAWRAFLDTLGDRDSNVMGHWFSARQAAEEVTAVLMHETHTLLENPMVSRAYDEFLMICRLTGEKND